MKNEHPHTCLYCHGNPAYHRREARRIAQLFDSGELESYTEDGPVKCLFALETKEQP